MLQQVLGWSNQLKTLVLDQRLVRENPNLIASELGRRGINVDLSSLQQIAKKQRDIEEERSKLQAQGNLIGKEVGQKIKSGSNPKSTEIEKLRSNGNQIKKKVAILEEQHLNDQ